MQNDFFSIDSNGNVKIKGEKAFFMVEDDYADFEDGDVIPCFVLNYFKNSSKSISNGDEALLFIPAYEKNGKACEANFVIANIGDKVIEEHKGKYNYYFVPANQYWCNVKQ